MTAANSTPLTDGASAVLLCSEDYAASRGWEPLAFLTWHETAAVDYVHGGEGLLMAPAYAMPRMLARAGLGLQDFDFYEIHEAFASQVLATLRAWEDPIFCKERLGPGRAARRDRPRPAQRRRVVTGRGSPVRGDRRADHRDAGQAAGREGLRPGRRLDLRGRRAGRHRDPRALTRPTAIARLASTR